MRAWMEPKRSEERKKKEKKKKAPFLYIYTYNIVLVQSHAGNRSTKPLSPDGGCKRCRTSRQQRCKLAATSLDKNPGSPFLLLVC